MSFVRLDGGEFPPLNKHSQQVEKSTTVNIQTPPKDNSCDNLKKNNSNLAFPSKNHAMENPKNEQIIDSSDFVKCRVGYQLNEYREDLEHVLRINYIGQRGDFILAPIAPIRPWSCRDNFEALPDLILPGEIWHQRVAIDLTHPPTDHFNNGAAKRFDQLFRHALYLSTPVIVITCPDSDLAYISIASTINDQLRAIRIIPLILIRVPVPSGSPILEKSPETLEISFTTPTLVSDSGSSVDHSDCEQNLSKSQIIGNVSPTEWTSESSYEIGNSSQESRKSSVCPWTQWNSIRSHLNPDLRVGVCLTIDDDLTDNEAELSRWMGEPVRMVIIHADQFTRSPGPSNSLQLNFRCEEFLRKLAIANSLTISFVIAGRPRQDITEYLQYLDYMAYNIKEQNNEYLLDWNDKIQPPLQPLSSNLTSSTYGVFEMDSMKYIKYRDAMTLAIKHFISQQEDFLLDRRLVVMVLGAGRGPLVDSFINAIKSAKTSFKFTIYALDKNPSSVLSLKYKSKNNWVDKTGLYETVVVEADMRSWNPGVKADIIATELLGSLSDNELSPECIDGVWKFTTPTTISIPQDYASYIAPICSYKLHQEMQKYRLVEPDPFDQIYVVRLTNCYHIAYPQQLFKFEHKDLSLDPSKRCNERYTRLLFWSKVDTVCHGFAGYFTSNLFGKVTLSTLMDQKTPNMDSWFPAFIPLENPVQMPKGTKLEIHFWRKESVSSVWYQWVVTSPIRSRIYTQYGLNSAMSKSI